MPDVSVALVRGGQPCVSCRPRSSGECRNVLSSPKAVASSSNRHGSSSQKDDARSFRQRSPSVAEPQVDSNNNDSSSLSSALPQVGSSSVIQELYNSGPSSLPSLQVVSTARVITLQHVPKAVRNVWAKLVAGVLNSICAIPSDLDSWAKLSCSCSQNVFFPLHLTESLPMVGYVEVSPG